MTNKRLKLKLSGTEDTHQPPIGVIQKHIVSGMASNQSVKRQVQVKSFDGMRVKTSS